MSTTTTTTTTAQEQQPVKLTTAFDGALHEQKGVSLVFPTSTRNCLPKWPVTAWSLLPGVYLDT